MSINEDLVTHARNKDFEKVKECIALGADVLYEDSKAFRYAAYNNHFEILIYLEQNGANINADEGFALKRGLHSNNDIARYLIGCGADTSRFDSRDINRIGEFPPNNDGKEQCCKCGAPTEYIRNIDPRMDICTKCRY